MRASILKRQASKGKEASICKNMFDPVSIEQPSISMAHYFEDKTEEPSVQLILPLNPVSEKTAFLSLDEEALEESFFSSTVLSDLRLLADMHGVHRARIRGLIDDLERAGCFDPDWDTGQVNVRAHLDEPAQTLVISFYGSRWTLADVKQVLGHYGGPTWYELVDMHDSPLPSYLPSDMGDDEFSGASTPLSTDSQELDDAAEHDRVAQSLRLPRLSGDSYLWGVEQFIQELSRSDRPTFIR